MGYFADVASQIELRLKYKFRLILDETWSFGVLGRTGRGITEHQNVDAAEVDMIVGSLAGPLVAGGGFCAGSEEIVHHQRISAAAYTFSAALPALLSTTASATINILQNSPETVTQLRDLTKAMRAQLDPRSDWVYCSSSPENPILILVLKPEVVAAKRLTPTDQQFLLQDVVDEVCIAFPLFPLSSLVSNFSTVSGQQCPHHTPEDPRGQLRAQAGCTASSEGVCHDWSHQKRDREVRHNHPARHYQGDEQEEVIDTLSSLV
jgi:7-keto-8-aminopelargonate synthetase-like enzyme